MGATPVVRFERKESVGWVHLCQPGKRNAMDAALFRQLKQAFDQVRSSPETRVVVLAAEGDHFCAGLDLAAAGQELLGDLMADPGPASRVRLLDAIAEAQDATCAPFDCPVPVIAAIQGACIGGGLDLVANCDIRLATNDACFCLKEVAMGLVADLGSLQRLPRIIGEGRLREMAYTARKVGAEEALRMGLVQEVYPDLPALLDGASILANRIAAGAPLAVRGTKSILNQRLEAADRASLRSAAAYNTGILPSEDLMEAVTAFFEKRQPVFKGR